MTTAPDLDCTWCGRRYELASGLCRCTCGGPLSFQYDFEGTRRDWVRSDLDHAPVDMWRYSPVLPVRNGGKVVSMGEGWTPLIRARRLGDKLGIANLWIKDEALNPAGVWDARAAACAASVALERAWPHIGTASGEGASIACALYAAAAGLKARVTTHHFVPHAAEAELADAKHEPDPIRIEGLKTVAYEIAEQLDWRMPDVVLCNASDASEALAKGFRELAALGWVTGEIPDVFGAAEVVPRDGVSAALEILALEGIAAAPETGASVVDLRHQLSTGSVAPDKVIVIVNTASALNYSSVFDRRYYGASAGEADKLGGLITPR